MSSADASPPPASPDAVAVVTVNWNGWKLTLECLAALRQTQGADWRLFIVDNASTDGSLEHLSGLGEDVTLIASPINGGWTGGNNRGVEAALAAGFRHILLLNNDAFVEPDTLAALLRAKAAAPAGAVLGPIHLDAATGAFDFIGADYEPSTALYVFKSTDPADVAALPDLIETTTIKGAGIFADADHFARLGLFDDRFYLNYDETDWCYYAREKGLRLFTVKSARIRHVGSATIGGVFSPLQIYFLVRNGLLFVEKHGSVGQRIRHAQKLYWDARNLWNAAHPERPSAHTWVWPFLQSRDGQFAAFRRGVRDYLLRRFGDCPPIVRAWNKAA